MEGGRQLRSDVEKALSSEEPNYLVEAFKSQYNLIALGTAVGFAVLSGSFLPLIIAAGVELTVLPLMERFQRYNRARRREKDKHARKRGERAAMMDSLDERERERYLELEGLAEEIRQNYTGLDPSSQMLLDEVVSKLDFLLAFYLRMRSSVARYEHYFESTDPRRIQDRMARLEQEMARSPDRVKRVKARTQAVLVKRMERYQKALENKQLVDAQTETVQEVLHLLRDQSYSMRDPKTITEQLDSLVTSAEETERGVRDMEELLGIAQDGMLPDLIDDEDAVAEGAPEPPAVRQAVRPPAPPVRLPPLPGPAGDAPPQRKKITH
ncbi:MAG TPA: hypothetical protein VMT87_07285 [Vicinamibacteria bacterium]|nr:hypothetical protein [Vicinamibacteria bacterium]